MDFFLSLIPMSYNLGWYCFWLIWVRLPSWLSGKESTCSAGAIGDMGLISGLRRSPRGGNDKPLQYTCLENPMDRQTDRLTLQFIVSQRVGPNWSDLAAAAAAAICHSFSLQHSECLHYPVTILPERENRILLGNLCVPPSNSNWKSNCSFTICCDAVTVVPEDNKMSRICSFY